MSHVLVEGTLNFRSPRDTAFLRRQALTRGENPIASSRNGSSGRQTFAGDTSTEQCALCPGKLFQNGRGTQPVSIRAMTLRPGRISTLSVFCRCVLLQKAGGKRFVLAGCCALPWSGVLGTGMSVMVLNWFSPARVPRGGGKVTPITLPRP